tara:strand:+ start:7487 stop:8383 length:897 start_codon:yes stop_codon:yes gene_type:complete
MFVNKYTFANNLSGGTSYNINVPLGKDSGVVGQQETIEKDFINIEVENSVNPILDYEKIKLLPKHNADGILDNITYRVNLLDGGVFNTSLKWGDIDFDDDDFRFRKKSFTKSFLRLDFFDSDIVTNQNLVSFITLFPEFSYEDMSSGSTPLAVNYPVSFKLGNPLVDRNLNGEGFALYDFKDEILPSVPKNLYMRGTFNNAKTGISTGLMSSNNSSLKIDELISSTECSTTTTVITTGGILKNNLFTKYILTRNASGYYYKIDDTFSDNVDYKSKNTTISSPTNTNDYIINLYQINAV